MKNIKYFRMRFILLLLFLPCTLWASAEFSVIIDMTVIKPLCTINNNKEILINFESVSIDKIDGQEYKKKNIQFDIACPGINSADLDVQITGEATNFAVSENLLKTDNLDLGIKILADNKKLPINTWLPFAWPNQVPSLAVVLVKREGATLSDGQFNAGAVINLAYN